MRSGIRRQPRWIPLVVIAGLCLAVPAGAATLTGTVRNEAAAGLGNVDLDFVDQCSGDNIFLSGDKTAADGTFAIVVPAGTYDVRFTPPAGSTVAAWEIQNVVVSANASLGVITLHPGRLVSGTVLTPSLGPAAGVDLKFVDRATDRRVYLTKDLTNASGQYSVRVPPGAYDIDFRPASTTAFGDRVRLDLVVGASDVSGLSDVLLGGFVVSGSARDKNNNKLKNVDVDVFDLCTGVRIPTAHDNTDVNGNYAVVVPAGTYLFEFNPPACKSLETTRQSGVAISNNKNLGTETMKAAFAVSGVVHDHAGAVQPGVKLKFYDATTPGSPRQGTSGDRTDASGAFSVLLPTGTYHIDFEPPVSSTDQVMHLSSVVVGGATNLGTLTLAQGVQVSGHVTGPGALPVLNVNINAVDAVTRAPVLLAHDDTDSLGNFTVVVAPGTYDFQYDPPACSGLAPASQAGLSIAAPTALPTVNLVTGVHILGTVLDAGSLPVANVDLDVFPAGSSTKLYTPRDQTALDGTFDVLIAPGTYDIKFVPSSLAPHLRPALRTNQPIPVNTTLPNVVLADGLLVSGFVKAVGTLAPIPNVSVDFFPPGGGAAMLVSHHTTSALGDYAVAVEAGTWDILYTPPVGSGFPSAWRRGVTVSADLALSDQLLDPSLMAVDPAIASSYVQLSAPVPNPARHDVRFTVSTADGEAELTVWDLAGRRVATPWKGRANSSVTIHWNGTTERGEPVPAGLYFVRLEGAAGTRKVRSVLFLH